MTFIRAGIEWSSEFTTVLIPSFLLTTLSGLNALNALKPLMKDMSRSMTASKIQVRIPKQTMIKSKIFQLSLR